MSNKMSDAEAHELVMRRMEARSREEWQALLDATRDVFDRQESIELNGRNGSAAKATKKPASKSRPNGLSH
jgi:hypothetical protein